MTKCVGAYAVLAVPGALLDEILPGPYEPYYEGVITLVVVEVNDCAKVALNGVDVGAASISMVNIYVKDPPGPPPKEDVVPFFTPEVRTNNPAVAAWFERLGATVAEGTANTTAEPANDPLWWVDVDAVVRNDTGVAYAFTATPPKPEGNRERAFRYFFGEDPSAHFVEGNLLDENARGEAPGRFDVGSDTVVAEIFGGPGTHPTSISVQNLAYRFMAPPATVE